MLLSLMQTLAGLPPEPPAPPQEEEELPIEDDYDPRKPEYIIPADDEEIERKNLEIRTAQMAKLASHVRRRSVEMKCPAGRGVTNHYESILEDLRMQQLHPLDSTSSSSRPGRARGHMRMRSEPNFSHHWDMDDHSVPTEAPVILEEEAIADTDRPPAVNTPRGGVSWRSPLFNRNDHRGVLKVKSAGHCRMHSMPEAARQMPGPGAGYTSAVSKPAALVEVDNLPPEQPPVAGKPVFSPKSPKPLMDSEYDEKLGIRLVQSEADSRYSTNDESSANESGEPNSEPQAAQLPHDFGVQRFFGGHRRMKSEPSRQVIHVQASVSRSCVHLGRSPPDRLKVAPDSRKTAEGYNSDPEEESEWPTTPKPSLEKSPPRSPSSGSTSAGSPAESPSDNSRRNSANRSAGTSSLSSLFIPEGLPANNLSQTLPEALGNLLACDLEGITPISQFTHSRVRSEPQPTVHREEEAELEIYLDGHWESQAAKEAWKMEQDNAL